MGELKCFYIKSVASMRMGELKCFYIKSVASMRIDIYFIEN